MRQVSTEQGSSSQGGVPLKCTGTPNEGSPKVFEAPLFSRATSLEPKSQMLLGYFHLWCKIPSYQLLNLLNFLEQTEE
ncbi:hypothetical protein LguiB_015896 [Lonicera macranthoides]